MTIVLNTFSTDERNIPYGETEVFDSLKALEGELWRTATDEYANTVLDALKAGEKRVEHDNGPTFVDVYTVHEEG